MDTDRVTEAVDGVTGRWGPSVLRWTAAMLWLGNLAWKVPPGFGRTAKGCSSVCGYTAGGVEHPVLPGAPWFFDNVVSPHLWAFGWLTVVVEATLAALLMSGRYRRIAAGLGIVQSFAIMAAVANSPGEWYWSYLLMIALHIAVLTTTPRSPAPGLRSMAGATVGFGLVMIAAHVGQGLTGTAFGLFKTSPDLPGDFARNVFGGSVLLGLIVAVVGVVALVFAGRLDAPAQRIIAMVLLGLAFVSLFTYDADGLVIGLGATTTTAAVIGALGLALGVAGNGRDAAHGQVQRAEDSQQATVG